MPIGKFVGMKFIFLLMTLSLVQQKCGKKKAAVPDCISQKIGQIQKEPKWNPPAEVNEYSYKGKRVYLFSSNCCDQYNYLYDNDCNVLCAPSGGFTGKGDIKCNDFSDSAKHVRLVWKDDRQ